MANFDWGNPLVQDDDINYAAAAEEYNEAGGAGENTSTDGFNTNEENSNTADEAETDDNSLNNGSVNNSGQNVETKQEEQEKYELPDTSKFDDSKFASVDNEENTGQTEELKTQTEVSSEQTSNTTVTQTVNTVENKTIETNNDINTNINSEKEVNTTENKTVTKEETNVNQKSTENKKNTNTSDDENDESVDESSDNDENEDEDEDFENDFDDDDDDLEDGESKSKKKKSSTSTSDTSKSSKTSFSSSSGSGGGSLIDYKTSRISSYNEEEATQVQTKLSTILGLSYYSKANVSSIIDSIKAQLSEETRGHATNLDDIGSGMKSLISQIIDSLESSKANIGNIRRKIRLIDNPHSDTSPKSVAATDAKDNENKTTDEEDAVEDDDDDSIEEFDANGASEVEDETDDVDEKEYNKDDVTGNDNVDSSNSSVTEKTVDDVNATGNNNTISNNTTSVGQVNFEEEVPLYKQIGEDSTEKSSTTSSYELVGIEKNNDKYYYKIVDNDNNTYYTDVSDKAKLNSNIDGVIEIKEPTLKLNTPNLNGDDNFNDVLAPNDVCFVTEKGMLDSNNQNIELAKIQDYNGKEGYVQIGDRAEFKTLDSLISESNS